jgi:hypothetical protein
MIICSSVDDNECYVREASEFYVKLTLVEKDEG